jgi:putative transposase
VPNAPHHVTQRGNRREPVFFEDGDHLRYLAFLKRGAEKSGTEVWAYCLMPNHVHMIVVPGHADGLREMFSDAHRQYTNFINWRQNWTGHLWQGRFGSVAMDEGHLAAALRYVALNPVRAGLVKNPEDWLFSSVSSHLSGQSDGLVNVSPILSRYPNFAELIKIEERPREFDTLRKSETTGRPLGSNEWLSTLEEKFGRQLKKR